MTYRFGPFLFDTGQESLFRSGRLIPLNPRATRVLHLLLENHGRVVTKETLLSEVWKDTFVEENNLAQCITALRRALGDDRNGTTHIQTLTKRGYCFVERVTVETANRTSRNISPPLRNPAAERAMPAPQSPPVRAVPGMAGSVERDEWLSLRRVASDSRFWLSVVSALIVAFVIAMEYYRREVPPPTAPIVLGYSQLTHDGREKGGEPELLTDGSKVYFQEFGNGDAIGVLVSVPVEGGEVAEVPVPPGFVVSDVSRGGSEYLGSIRAPDGVISLAMVSASGKSIQWLIQPRGPANDPPWKLAPSWSPRRNRISFSLPGEVLVAKLDTGRIRTIAHVDGRPNWQRWSPDRRTVAFSVVEAKAETMSLWQVNADGTHLHELSFPEYRFGLTCCGSWTPDGKFLIFDAEQNGRRDVWAVREAGQRSFGAAKPVRVTSGPLNYLGPVTSRNGKEVFVVGRQTRGELMRFDLKSHSFVEFLGGISAAELSYSRDGKRIAYVTYPDYTLWCARADGSNAHQLTFPPLEAREPRWSPDGKLIAFQGISYRNHYKIYIVPSAGGHAEEAVPGGGEQSVGTWWPDGQSLLYDEPLFRHDPSQMFLYRLDLKTRMSVRIPRSGGSWTARLSPDGRYIVTLDATGNADPHHLIVLDAVTGRRILDLAIAHPAEPTWSRDGKYIYFAVINSPTTGLYRVNLRDKRLEKLTSLSGFPVAGLWTGVAPDGSPLLLHDISTEEVYAIHLRLP